MNSLVDTYKDLIERKNISYTEMEKIVSKNVKKTGLESFLIQLSGKEDYIRILSIALTHYAFRNGPIEDMHAGKFSIKDGSGQSIEQISQLTQNDMKILNKYMVDKIAFILHLFREERFLDIITLLDCDIAYAKESEWDDPNIFKEEKNLHELKEVIFE